MANLTDTWGAFNIMNKFLNEGEKLPQSQTLEWLHNII